MSDVFLSSDFNIDQIDVVSYILSYKNSKTFSFKGSEFGVYYNRFLYGRNFYDLLGIKAFVTTHEQYNSQTRIFASLGFGNYIVRAISVEFPYKIFY